MGKGIALAFRREFPGMFDDYVRRCERGEVRLGEPYLYTSLVPPQVICFPTKGHWRSVSQLEDIVRGLKHLEKNVEKWNVESLAVPPLGCGNGRLDWTVVGPILYRHLDRLSVPVELYAPAPRPPT